jgi:hypothetical protein
MDLRGMKRRGDEENCIMKSFIICSIHQILLGRSNESEIGGTRSVHEGDINAYEILVGKLEGKRPLGRHRRRWENKFKMELRKRGLEGVNWIHLTQNRDGWWALVNMVTGSIKGGDFHH